MDVTCERCQIEYEFDETLISDRGTTVKCTHCGHLFKIYRKGSGAEALPGSKGRVWTLRKPSGELLTFDRLTTLQQWIMEGKVGRDDEISRTGELWKELGKIAELATFFAAAEAATPDNAATSPTMPRFKTPPMGMPAAAPRPAATAPARRTPAAMPAAALQGARSGKATMLGVAGHVSAAPAAVEPRAPVSTPRLPAPVLKPHATPRPAPPPPAPPPPPPTREIEQLDRSLPSVRESRFDQAGVLPAVAVVEPGGELGDMRSSIASSQPAWTQEQLPAQTHVDEFDDGVPMPTHRSSNRRLGVALTAVVLVLVSAIVLAVFGRSIGRFFGGAFTPPPETPAQDRAGALIKRGHEALQMDTDEGYDAATELFLQARGIRERDARVLAGLGEALVLQAQNLRDQADDLDEKARRIRVPQESPAEALAAQAELRALARRLRADFDAKLVKARTFATDALRVDANLVDAHRAQADVLRLGGQLEQARAELAKALQHDGSMAENRYSAAMIALEQPDGRSQAMELLGAALAEKPALLRVAMRLARLDAMGGDGARARARLHEMMRASPGHPRATALLAAIEAGDPPVTPIVIATAPDTHVEPSTSNSASPPPARTEPPTGEPPSGRSYEWYVGEGERLQHGGQQAQARAMFEQALQRQPSGSEALAGLGFVLLSLGNPQGAMQQFQRLLNVNPSYAPAAFGMGEAARRSGQAGVAARHFRRYLEMSPNGARAEQARGFLQTLEAVPEDTATPAPPSDGDAPLPPDTGSALPAPVGSPANADIPQSDTPALESSSPTPSPQ